PVGWKIALTTIGKLGIGIAFTAAYIVTAELVPTHVRNIAIGMCSVIARIGSGTAPFIVDLLVINASRRKIIQLNRIFLHGLNEGDIYYAIPFIIFGVLAMVSAFLTLLLPETGTKRLPESVEEIELSPR
ncbi:Solute carrier family 22 member 15, partial [Armadillidium nasatum]